MKKNILIAGAGGYLGSRMVEFFLEKGYAVTALDRYYFGDVLDDLAQNKNLRIVKDDIRSLDTKYLKDQDAVINLASISNDPAAELNPHITHSINYEGAVHLAKEAKKAGCTRYVFASSCSVYGQGQDIVTEESPLAPVSEYARSKIHAEEALLKLADKNFVVTNLRFATLYGLSRRRMRFDLMINIMTLHALKKNKIFVMGGGNQWRPLMHVDDCIHACYLVSKTPDTSKIQKQVFNVGSNEQNYQVGKVAYVFKKYFPQLQIEETPEDPDKRSYRVNFDKIVKTLRFKPEKNIEDGIIEIKAALEQGIIDDTIKTSTLNYYKYLIEAERTLESVKYRNTLF